MKLELPFQSVDGVIVPEEEFFIVEELEIIVLVGNYFGGYYISVGCFVIILIDIFIKIFIWDSLAVFLFVLVFRVIDLEFYEGGFILMTKKVEICRSILDYL